jgi:hypothetical protein
MGKGMNTRPLTLAAPQWMAVPISGHLVAGGVKLDVAAFPADADGRKPVKSGTVVGRTYAEMVAAAPFGPAAGTDDEIFILAFDVTDLLEDNDATLLKGNIEIFENYLPEAPLAAGILASVREKYICKQGVK